jgi:hypothetical protein
MVQSRLEIKASPLQFCGAYYYSRHKHRASMALILRQAHVNGFVSVGSLLSTGDRGLLSERSFSPCAPRVLPCGRPSRTVAAAGFLLCARVRLQCHEKQVTRGEEREDAAAHAHATHYL